MMVSRNQFVRKPRLQWSLLLAVLLGVCSLSAPHLLSHAHAHHNAAGSRTGGTSHRSRSGSSSADGEHDSDASALTAFDPHTPDHNARHVAIVPAALFPPVQWIALAAVAPHDEAVASLLQASPHRGRAPPVA
jgi:hypothetical protein